MKILIIDDNESLAERIQDRLAPHYVTDIATTGRSGVDRAMAYDYGAILLDLNLPDISGLEACQLLRSRSVSSPILILTADDSIKSRVALLDAGADDFLAKPFNGEELRARIGALLRRPTIDTGDTVLAAGGLTFDPVRRDVRYDGHRLSLTRKEYDILEYLLHNKGRIRTRAQIFNYAWNGDSNSLNGAVDVHIKHLRDKISRIAGADPAADDDALLIHTIHGIGYKVDDPKVVKIGEKTR